MATDGNEENASLSLSPGATLSDTYEIERQIALGGMAEVYRARNIHTDEPVAVKVVLPEFAKDQTILALFKKEATVLSRLHHDAIVHYHLFTVEREMNRPYMVMEFVDGVPLSDHIRRAPLDAASTRVLITRVAAGLAAAHDLGVIHRDLSPDNVILPEDNVAKTKIIDFGIAKAGKIGQGTLLGDKFAGKYNFVSPEQLGLAGGEVTERSDIYALGLVAAAALLGRPIDMAGNGSHADVLDRRRVVPDLTGIDPTLQPIVAAMLAPNPADRPNDMRAVIDLVASAPSFEPAVARPAYPSQPPQSGTGTVFGADLPGAPPPQPRSSPPGADPWATGAGGPQQSMQPQSMPPQSMPPQSLPPRSMPPQTERDPFRDPTNIGGFAGSNSGFSSAAPQSAPAVDFRSMPPGSMPPQSMPPQSMPPQSMPPHSMPPQSMPPHSMPQADGSIDSPGAVESESPFGPYVDAPGKFKLPPEKPKARGKQGGAPVALILVALIVVAGGGGFAATQNFFGLLGPSAQPGTPATPNVPAEPQPPEAPADEEEPAPEDITPLTPGDEPDPPLAEEPAEPPPETPVQDADPAGEPDAVEEPVDETEEPGSTVLTAENDPVVPDLPTPPVTPTPSLLEGAAGNLAFVEAYPLDECQYAASASVANTAISIEAFGSVETAFDGFASEFEAARGFKPDVGLRLIDETQCAVADFLRKVAPSTVAGPRLSMTRETVTGEAPVEGSVSDTEGWTTDLLLVDQLGTVQNISAFLTGEDTKTFGFQARARDDGAVPMMIIAVSSRDGLASTSFSSRQAARVIFPVIQNEIEETGGEVSVSAGYFRLGS